MKPQFDFVSLLITGPGMMLVAVMGVIIWRRAARVPMGWFWAGAALWAVAVAMKVAIALATNAAVFGWMKHALSHSLFVAGGSLWLGFLTGITEIGLTFAAVLRWRQLGADANRAIAVGVGAGAIEALILGLAQFAGVIALQTGAPGTEPIRKQWEAGIAVTPLFWLTPIIERLIALLCHAASRALVLLGVAHRKPMMVAGSFVMFTLLDSVAGVFFLTGKVGRISSWWIELAVLPFALASLLILRGCYRRWPKSSAVTANPSTP